MFKKLLIISGLILFLTPIFSIEAIDVPFVVTYFLNEVSSDVTANPLVDPIKLSFVAEGNVENWVSLKIEKIDDSSIYKSYSPGSDCDNTDRCEEFWGGEISASGKTLTDGAYRIVIHIKNTTDPIFDLTLTSPYSITVDTSATSSDTTAPVVTLLGEATVNLTVGDTYTDAGVTVMDDVDGDLTASTTSITVVGLHVDTSASSTQYVIYTVTDSSSNSASSTRTINISDPAPIVAPIVEPAPSHSSGFAPGWGPNGFTGVVAQPVLFVGTSTGEEAEGQVLGTSTSRMREEIRQRRLAHYRRRLLAIKRELLLLEHPEIRDILTAEGPIDEVTPATTSDATATTSTSTDPVKKPFWKFW